MDTSAQEPPHARTRFANRRPASCDPSAQDASSDVFRRTCSADAALEMLKLEAKSSDDAYARKRSSGKRKGGKLKLLRMPGGEKLAPEKGTESFSRTTSASKWMPVSNVVTNTIAY